MWTKKYDHAPKNECVDSFQYIPKNGSFEKKINLDHTIIFLALFLFISFIFLFWFVFSLNFSKHGCNGRENKEVVLIIHVCKACCGYSSNDFARRMGEDYGFKYGL